MARVAKSLDTLRSQINRAAPDRDKSSDGWIGDASHAKRRSEHNPNPKGVVTALDVTDDPKHGVSAAKITEALRQHRDKRIQYVIHNKRIFNSTIEPWTWRKYTGSDPHAHHFHISTMQSQSLYDDPSRWDLSGSGLPSELPPPKQFEDVNFSSLVPGGFFSSTPMAKPTSIMTNNPGAINAAAWVQQRPGYVGEYESSPGNHTAVFRTPEQGVATWWELLRRYHDDGATSIGEIINKYGGGQNYRDYLAFMTKRGLTSGSTVDLNDDDQLLQMAKAMFRYEAGRETPLSDAQILYGLNLAQSGGVDPEEADKSATKSTTIWGSIWSWVTANLGSLYFLRPDNKWAFIAFLVILVVSGIGIYFVVTGRLRVQGVIKQLSGEA